MVDRVKSQRSPGWADFTIMMECTGTPESGHCHSVCCSVANKTRHNCVAKSERQPTPTMISQHPTTDTPQPMNNNQHLITVIRYSTTNIKQLTPIDTPKQHNKHPTTDMETVEKWENSAILTETTENHSEHAVFAKISTQTTCRFQ
jgi:hypothetical protein